MSTQVISGAKLFVAGYNFSGQTNSLGMSHGVEELDATTIEDDTRIREGGLFTFGMSHEGFWAGGADQIDDVLFSKIGLSDEIMTMCPVDGTEGSVAYSGLLNLASYNPGGQVGELFAFNVEGEASGLPIRGTIVHNGEESGNHIGTAFNLGAVASGQSVYAALHVFSGSGDLDVKVASDAVQAFTTSPEDQITFTQVGTATARASERKVAAGPITDTWWRMEATNPATRNWAVVVAIR